MSLLMEALRKAEEAKRRMQQEDQAAATGKDARDVADAPAPNASPKNTANSPFTLEDREDLTPDFIRENFTSAQGQADTPHAEPAAVAPPAAEPEFTPQPEPAPSARNLSRRQQRAAAASVFQAKQGATKNRRILTILVIVMVVMIPVGGGVLWYLQSVPTSSISVNPALANYDLSSRSLSDTPPPAPSPAATPPAGIAAVTSPEQPTPAAQPAGDSLETTSAAAEVTTVTEVPAGPAVETAPETSAEPVAEAAPDIAATIAPPPLPGIIAPATAAPADAVATPADAERPPVLEISRTRATSQVNPDLVAAYESLQSGDLATAGRLYQQLLDTLPNNRDAMLGLALVHQRQDDPVSARDLYARMLRLNPRDPLAQTGLLQTMPSTDPAENEKALQALISQYPDVAQLTLALGNLYAAQQRWSEAQGAYYNALLTASRSTGGPVNPDYAFNLAVSLEQLDEPKAALRYYQQAQELARVVTPGFDIQLLNRRLDVLSTQAQP